MHRKSIDNEVLAKKPGQNIKNGYSLNPHNEHTAILMLVANEKIRNYMLQLCSENDYDCFAASDPEDLVTAIKELGSAIAFVDYEAVDTYGARIYSRINATGTGCNVILLSDKDHKNLIKEAMELGAYACILTPYPEWEVRTMIRNILAKKKLKR
ncbi:response regulator [Thermodesulfobacteriota bacterium]